MIVKAIKTYKDKHTGGMVPAGVLLHLDKKRVQELNTAKGGPYVESFELEAAQAEPEASPQKTEPKENEEKKSSPPKK